MRISQFLAQAPSNIALIKYMGKDDASTNVAANASLSMTLDSLRTSIQVTRHETEIGLAYRFVPELPEGAGPGAQAPLLGDAAVRRFLSHAERIERALPGLLARHGLSRLQGGARFDIRTANTFPAASGIASSASSFAALTLGLGWALSSDPEAFRRAYEAGPGLRRDLAMLSRQGSGSSCRSFEGPWVVWDDQSAAAMETRMPRMKDLVALVSSSPKEVSSSQAHALVKTSPLWAGRTERVADRLRTLQAALGEGDWASVVRTSWSEMWEMHSLFHTCSEPFSYWAPGSMAILQWLAPRVRAGEPVVVTMDAGPNVHLLVAEDRAAELARQFREAFPEIRLLEDSAGGGASLVELRSGS